MTYRQTFYSVYAFLIFGNFSSEDVASVSVLVPPLVAVEVVELANEAILWFRIELTRVVPSFISLLFRVYLTDVVVVVDTRCTFCAG